jgi:hypothetical protein
MRFIAVLFVCFLSLSVYCVEYTMKLPVPATAKVEEVNGKINIEAIFKPTRAFNTQLNRKVDRQHAERICREAIRRYFDASRDGFTYSQLQVTRTPQYSDGKAVYAFSIPRNAVRLNASAAGNKKVAATASDTLTAQSGVTKKSGNTEAPKKNTVSNDKVATESSVNTKAPAMVSHKNLKLETSESCGKNNEGDTVAKGIARPVKHSLITDADLEKMPLMGYAVRLKKDYQTMFELRRQEMNGYKDCEAQWENLEAICALKKEYAADLNIETVRKKHKYDAKLTGRDLDELLQYVAKETASLESEMGNIHRRIYNEIKKDLENSRLEILKTANGEASEDLKVIVESLDALASLQP